MNRRTQIIKPGQLSRREWAKRLNDQWDHVHEVAVEGFIRLGRDLHAAKSQLGTHGHGQWMAMVREDLKFRQNIANCFMRIATWVDKNVVNDHNLPKRLPPDYNSIDKLTRLDNKIFGRLIKNGTICPTIKREEVSKILRIQRVKSDEKRILDLKPIQGKFRTLIFDPAWEYGSLSIAGRAKPGYALQTLDELRALDILQWAEPECHLYVWTTNNFLYEACKLVDGWGFQHRTLLTGYKSHFGLGSYFRNSTEHVLFATLGDTTTRPAAANISTHFEFPSGLEHSEKPEVFYDIVRKASYPPYGEGNQRTLRSGFTSLFQPISSVLASTNKNAR
jgi:N6-adenosine-specific RNA methylase IME4